jgi:hypothetical protein
MLLLIHDVLHKGSNALLEGYDAGIFLAVPLLVASVEAVVLIIRPTKIQKFCLVGTHTSPSFSSLAGSCILS